MAETEINVVGLSSGKKGGKTNWKIIGAIIGIVVLALGIIAGILLVRQQQDIREKAQIVSCTDPTIEQCPVAGSPNILRNCHPPEADNSPVESLCNTEGKTAFCGNKNYCCPSAGGAWTSDLTACKTDPTITITSTEGSISCSEGFTDTFDSGIDSSRWNQIGDASIVSGTLQIKREEAGVTPPIDAIFTKKALTGDFVIEVDIPSYVKTGTGGGGATVILVTDDPNTDRLTVMRRNSTTATEHKITSQLAIGTASTAGTEVKIPSTSPLTIKIERKAGKFTVLYKTTAGYIQQFSATKTLTKDIQGIYLSAMNTGTSSNTVVTYDNFRISCGTTSATATATSTSTGNVTATATATATGTGTRTATPTATSTATGVRTATPTATNTSGIGGGVATATATSRATAVVSSAPIPVTGVNLPTLLGTGFGVIMILVSLALAL